jgi:thioesterase domain-containing protein
MQAIPAYLERHASGFCTVFYAHCAPMTVLKDFEKALLADIPLARAMQLHARAYDGDSLQLAAPLAPNVNDKGCAFGGSLLSLLTLAGWGLIVLKLQEVKQRCDVFVQDSDVRYIAPVWDNFSAEARLAAGESWTDFTSALRARGRARIRVACHVPLPTGVEACVLKARFVAIRTTE